jgi:5-enolpyruvylshikimate-3-phosphate synthase
LAKSQDFCVQLAASIVTARVQAASGGFSEAIRELGETIARAEKSGYAGLALEGKLALGEVELAADNVSQGKSTLSAVRLEAQRKGYNLVASKANRKTAVPISSPETGRRSK